VPVQALALFAPERVRLLNAACRQRIVGGGINPGAVAKAWLDRNRLDITGRNGGVCSGHDGLSLSLPFVIRSMPDARGTRGSGARQRRPITRKRGTEWPGYPAQLIVTGSDAPKCARRGGRPELDLGRHVPCCSVLFLISVRAAMPSRSSSVTVVLDLLP